MGQWDQRLPGREVCSEYQQSMSDSTAMQSRLLLTVGGCGGVGLCFLSLKKKMLFDYSTAFLYIVKFVLVHCIH